MTKVFCDVCKEEADKGYIGGELKLFTNSGERAKYYRLEFCPKCMKEIITKLKNDGIEEI